MTNSRPTGECVLNELSQIQGRVLSCEDQYAPRSRDVTDVTRQEGGQKEET